MALQLFLNELSFAADQCVQAVAVRRLKAFASTVRAAESLGRQIVLNADQPLAELSFGANWPLAMLRNVPECAEERILLKTIKDRSPYGLAIQDLGGPAEAEFDYRMVQEAQRFPERQARGLGLAHNFGGLALSLATDDFWELRVLDLNRNSLQADGEIVAERVSARNACSEGGVGDHRAELEAALRPTVFDGVSLWARREELFPHLAFLPHTRQQIEVLRSGDANLQPLLERLLGLEQAVATWAKTGGPHPNYGFNVRPESTRRIRRGLFDFNDGAGGTYTFSDHADFGPNEGRLHFLLESAPTRRALIGHADRKIGIG